MNQGGRPPKEVDKTLLKQLAGLGCTMKEMGSIVGVSVATLERGYADIIEEGRESAKSSLRRMLWAQAQKGNTFALKHLVSTVLKERVNEEIDVNVLVHKLTKMTEQEFQLYADSKLTEVKLGPHPEADLSGEISTRAAAKTSGD